MNIIIAGTKCDLEKHVSEEEALNFGRENGVPVIYDDINPAFTVMTNAGTFENVRFNNCSNHNIS